MSSLENLRTIGLSLLATVGLCSGVYIVYTQYWSASPDESTINKLEDETENSVPLDEGANEVIQDIQTSTLDDNNNYSNEEQKVIGDTYMALVGLILMIIVTVVAIMVSLIDNTGSSAGDYRLYSPLMWIGAGMITASCPSQISSYLPRTRRPSSVDSIRCESSSFPSRGINNETAMTSHSQDSVEERVLLRERTSVATKEPPLLKEVIDTAERLYNEMKHQEIYDYLKKEKIMHANILNTAEILWRLARATRDLMEAADSRKKRALAFEALDYAALAIQKDDNNASAHKWFAIMTSEAGNFLDTSKKIAGAYKIKEHITRAISLDPNDATSRNIYGRWCLAVADISWIEKKAAAALYGAPPSSSYEEALTHFHKAEEINPGFWKQNTFLIAQTYFKLKDMDKARYWAKKTSEISNITAEDYQVQLDVKALIAQLK